MSSFTTPFTKPLIVEYVGEDRKKAIWEITESFEYHIGSYPSDKIISIDAGFQTDFASIPRPLWSIFPPTGKYIKAAVIHDYLTDNKGKVFLLDPKTGEKSIYTEYTKKEVDAIFKEAMTVLGVSKIVRFIVWRAVTLFGDKTGYKQ